MKYVLHKKVLDWEQYTPDGLSDAKALRSITIPEECIFVKLEALARPVLWYLVPEGVK